jgi:hypothetical protein
MRRLVSRTLIALVASVAALLVSCGVDNALVGGRCAPGYTQCGTHCVKGTACNAPSDASNDQQSDAAGEAAAADGSWSDSAIEEDDGASDGGNAEASRTDGGSSDASTGEGGENDGGMDGANADAPMDGTRSADAMPDSGVSDSSVSDSTSDGSEANDSSANDSEAGNPCVAPLVYCGGQCIDVSSDPLNCGGCNIVCASQLCANSHCVGAASGGIVYIGHDYSTTLPGTAQARVLSNAAFTPQANPLHVMSYERYASASAISHVDTILRNVATQLGRTLSIRSTTNDTDVPTQLALPAYDVLLVHDQVSASDGALAVLGASWASTLTTFTLGGGVVVVLDGGGGIAQMPAFATATGLLNVTANFPITTGTPLDVASRLDVIGIGVISPYGAGQSSVSIATEANGGNVVYVVEIATAADAGPGAPVVVHKAF